MTRVVSQEKQKELHLSQLKITVKPQKLLPMLKTTSKSTISEIFFLFFLKNFHNYDLYLQSLTMIYFAKYQT